MWIDNRCRVVGVESAEDEGHSLNTFSGPCRPRGCFFWLLSNY